MKELLQKLDPKWVISGLITAVAIGSVANYRVGANAADAASNTSQIRAVESDLRAGDRLVERQVRTNENRIVRLETKLEDIDETTKEILLEVKNNR